MKSRILFLFGLLITTAICSAQDNQPAPFDAGWFAATNVGGLNQDSTSYPYTANPPYPGGSSAIAEAITPDITALAQNLQNNPTLIYNYVHDQIQYSHYFGSHKGAEMTLLERSGNDFDECALLVALLRAAGYSPNYQFGMIEMPYSAPSQQDYQHWIGAMMPNTNWSSALQLYANLNGAAGFPYDSHFTGDTNDLLFHHVWVTLPINGTNYLLDPAFKLYEPESGINLDTAANLSTNTLISDVSVGATATADYVQGLNEGNLRRDLAACATNLANYLQSNYPNSLLK